DSNKGLDILFEALSQMNNYKWKLRIVGQGPLLEKLKLIANNLNISNRIEFIGVLNNQKAIELIERSDLLVLPTKYKEGWGVVINESLMVGTPALCSDICGGAALIRQVNNCQTFKSGSKDSLKKSIKSFLEKGAIT